MKNKQEEQIKKAFQNYVPKAQFGMNINPFNFQQQALGYQVPENIGYTPNLQENNYGFGNGMGQLSNQAITEQNLAFGQNWANRNPLPENIQSNLQNNIGYTPPNYTNETPTNGYKNWVDNNITNTFDGGIENQAALQYGLYNLGRGNTTSGVLGLSKAGLGMLREGLSSYSAGKANQYAANQYQQNQYTDWRKPVYAQEGGIVQRPLTDTQVNDINRNGLFAGLQVTPEFGKSGYFVTEEEFNRQAAQQPVQTDYSKLPIRDITSDGQFTDRKVWRTQKPEWFVGKQEPVQGRDYTTVPYSQWEGYQQSPEYMTYVGAPRPKQRQMAMFQAGGEVSSQSPSPEEIIQAFSQLTQQDPNAIVQQLQEMGLEQQQASLQQMMEALQSQVPQAREGGKITGAEAMTGEYAVEEPNGAPITVEVEDGEYVKDNKTGEIKKVVGDSHEDGGVGMNLEDAKIISNFTKVGADNAKQLSKEYDVKISSKDTFATVLDKITKKSGLEKLVEEEVKLTEQLEKVITNSELDENSQELNTQFLTGKMQEIKDKQIPLREYRSKAFEDVFSRQEKIPKKNGDLQVQYMQEGGYTNEDRRRRFRDWAQNMQAFGYQGNVDVQAKDLNREAGRLQKWMVENKPELVVDYFQTQPMTAKGVEIIKNQYPDAFKQAGIEANKQASQYTPQEKEALKGVLGNELNNQFWLDQFNDEKYDWRGILAPVGSELQPVVGDNANQITTSAVLPTPDNVEPTIADVANNAPQKEPTARQLAEGNFRFQPLYMQPSAVQPVMLAGVQAPNVRTDFVKTTVEPNLVELARQSVATQEQLGFLPDSQRAAMLATSFAQNQSVANQAISQAEVANQQAENAARLQQANLDFKSDITNQQFRQDYQNQVFGGQNAYEQGLQNYFNKAYNEPGQLAQLERNKINAYNQLFDKYKINNGQVTFVDNNSNIISTPAMGSPATQYVDINKLSDARQKQIMKDLKSQKK